MENGAYPQKIALSESIFELTFEIFKHSPFKSKMEENLVEISPHKSTLDWLIFLCMCITFFC